jgi:hypothetical protein
VKHLTVCRNEQLQIFFNSFCLHELQISAGSSRPILTFLLSSIQSVHSYDLAMKLISSLTFLDCRIKSFLEQLMISLSHALLSCINRPSSSFYLAAQRQAWVYLL